ncbi:MAG: hypothetical protein AB7F31_01780 [Parachlamydiales bacterium]
MDKERIFYLVTFIQGDIEAALEAAVRTAIEKRVRHVAGLEPIAREASLQVNQTLLGAKREFGIGGPQPQTPLDEETRWAFAKEIEALDAIHSLPNILEMLEERLGFPFVLGVRQRLEVRLKKERSGSLEAIHSALSQELQVAYEQARSSVTDPDLLRLVEGDLDQLRAVYLDPEFLKIRMQER